jgi:hypothetical protein
MLYLNGQPYTIGPGTCFVRNIEKALVTVNHGDGTNITDSSNGRAFEIYPVHNFHAFMTIVKAIATTHNCGILMGVQRVGQSEILTLIGLTDKTRPRRRGKK